MCIFLHIVGHLHAVKVHAVFWQGLEKVSEDHYQSPHEHDDAKETLKPKTALLFLLVLGVLVPTAHTVTPNTPNLPHEHQVTLTNSMYDSYKP